MHSIIWRAYLFLGKLIHPPSELPLLGADHHAYPSHGDKPSPHSSIPLDELHAKAQRDWPSDRFCISMVANTNSMEPLIDDNSVVVLEVLTPEVLTTEPLQAGDVVVFEHEGRAIIHMLLRYRIYEGRFWWMIGGLNNYLPDGEICASQATHRLVAVYYGQSLRPGD